MAKVFSRDDGNLSQSRRVTRTRLYSDIDLSLDARIAPLYSEGDGDILRKTDAASVKQAVKNLLLTNRFEKPYDPNFGGDLNDLLFELADPSTGDEIADRVVDAIETYEPRAKILDLKVVATPDYNSVSVVLEFRIVNSQISDTLRVKIADTAAAVTAVPPVTPPVEPENIILSEERERLLTLDNLLLRIDGLAIVDGAILTVPDENQLLTQDEIVLVVNQS
jgi:phage baseplate assembly protein W